MSELTRKSYNAIVKGVDKETGEVDVLIPMSTGSIDRDGETVLPESFRKRLKTFKARPILLSSHDYRNLQKQIGEFTQIKVTPEGLFGKPKYYVNKGNPEADWGFFLASEGMASYSIGFIPFEWDDDEDGDGDKKPFRTYTDVELMEISHVVVPSNRDAAQSMRGVLTAKGIKATEDLLDMIAIAELSTLEVEDLTEAKAEDSETVGIVETSSNAINLDAVTFEGTVKETLTVDATEEVKKPRAVSQEELKDEFDYCLSLIEEVGISDISKEAAERLITSIKRLTGSDIPDVIEPEEKQPEPRSIKELLALIEIRRQYGLTGGK